MKYILKQGINLDVKDIVQAFKDGETSDILVLTDSGIEFRGYTAALQYPELSCYVTSMEALFDDYPDDTLVLPSNFDTSRVTNMVDMFSGCKKLKQLDLSNFIITNVSDMRDMFCACTKLEFLNLKNFVLSGRVEIADMFKSCNQELRLIATKDLKEIFKNTR